MDAGARATQEQLPRSGLFSDSLLAGFNIAREVAILPVHWEVSGSYMVIVIASPFFWQSIDSNIKGIAYKELNLNTL